MLPTSFPRPYKYSYPTPWMGTPPREPAGRVQVGFREVPFSVARCWNHDLTTYATTYGWRSTGVRGDLMTSPPEQNLVNGGRKGLTGVYGIADSTTTNQKVAGSSPAERATQRRCSSQNQGHSPELRLSGS